MPQQLPNKEQENQLVEHARETMREGRFYIQDELQAERQQYND